MRNRKPPELVKVDKLRTLLEREHFRRLKFSRGRTMHLRCGEVERALQDLKDLEQFIITHIPEQEWERFLS